MILYVVVVRDRAADVFGQPTFTTALGMAVRSFADTVNTPDKDNVIAKHPEDFDLYSIGTYNDRTAKFEFEPDGPRMIAVGKDCVRK